MPWYLQCEVLLGSWQSAQVEELKCMQSPLCGLRSINKSKDCLFCDSSEGKCQVSSIKFLQGILKIFLSTDNLSIWANSVVLETFRRENALHSAHCQLFFNSLRVNVTLLWALKADTRQLVLRCPLPSRCHVQLVFLLPLWLGSGVEVWFPYRCDSSTFLL